jgi:hypothetical protein
VQRASRCSTAPASGTARDDRDKRGAVTIVTVVTRDAQEEAGEALSLHSALTPSRVMISRQWNSALVFPSMVGWAAGRSFPTLAIALIRCFTKRRHFMLCAWEPVRLKAALVE